MSSSSEQRPLIARANAMDAPTLPAPRTVTFFPFFSFFSTSEFLLNLKTLYLMRTQKESDPFCRRKTPCRSGTALVCRNAIDCECAIPFSGISLPHMPIQFHYSMNRNFLQDRIRFSVIFVTSYRNPPFETSILYKRQHPDNGHFCRSATESPEMTAMHRNLKKPVCFTVNFCDNFMKTA